jgi:hypothetical protein
MDQSRHPPVSCAKTGRCPEPMPGIDTTLSPVTQPRCAVQTESQIATTARFRAWTYA